MNHHTRHEPASGHPDVPVTMVRDHLNCIPMFDLPRGYTIRWFVPGDEEHWLRIHNECEGYGDLKPNLFADQYGSVVEVLSQRVAFVCRADGLPISTNTAWMNDWEGQHWGRVHWVATVRGEQGKGLSKPLMTAVCKRMAKLGHDRAYLTTNSVRIRAIALYAGFGFSPYRESDTEREAWEDVERKMEEIGRNL